MMGFMNLSIAMILQADATLVINKNCEPPEVQFPKRRTIRGWGEYCHLVSLG
jgi:hypothetical protein